MRLLLLLSAFLTALVGQGGIAHATVVPSTAVSATAQVAPERTARVPVLFDPVEQAVSALVRADRPALPAAPLLDVPLYQDRLRI
jgi:hypothetical protein